MVVVVVAGRGGTGKTLQLRTIAQIYNPAVWAIFEKKDEDNINSINEIQGTMIHEVDKKRRDDPIAMITAFERWCDAVNVQTDTRCIVVDGVSYLRKYALKEWIHAHPIYNQQTGKSEPRESIGKENISAWTDVDVRVQDLIIPLINYAHYEKAHLFITAEMKDIYINNVREEQEPNIKEWLEYKCDCLLEFTKDKRTKYYECNCIKAPIWSGDSGWVEELRKETGLLEVLSTHGLL